MKFECKKCSTTAEAAGNCPTCQAPMTPVSEETTTAPTEQPAADVQA